jgi:ribonucleoside-diphosphate reductase alpha chain
MIAYGMRVKFYGRNQFKRREVNKMKIKKITRNVAVEHTWDLSTNTEKYCLANGIVSHNTSAQISNATNGVEPPRSYVSVKQSKHGVLKQVVPEFRRLKNKYELLWNQKSPEGYLKLMAVLQKYIDQSISTNTSYNPEFYDEEKIPMSELLKHLLLCYKYGIKTLYYFNQYDGQGEIEVDNFMATNVESETNVSVADDADCDSCVI